ncbi:TPA: hypothetical protein AB5A43_003171 [Vibrio cholerae]
MSRTRLLSTEFYKTPKPTKSAVNPRLSSQREKVMSEDYKIYLVGSAPTTKEAFKNRPCTLPLSHPDFVIPTPQEVKALRMILGFSQAELGRFAGKKVTSKGCSQVRKWETSQQSDEHRVIDLGIWRMMLYSAGISKVSDDIQFAKGKTL